MGGLDKAVLLGAARRALLAEAERCEGKAKETSSEKYQALLVKRAGDLRGQAADCLVWQREIQKKWQ